MKKNNEVINKEMKEYLTDINLSETDAEKFIKNVSLQNDEYKMLLEKKFLNTQDFQCINKQLMKVLIDIDSAMNHGSFNIAAIDAIQEIDDFAFYQAADDVPINISVLRNMYDDYSDIAVYETSHTRTINKGEVFCCNSNELIDHDIDYLPGVGEIVSVHSYIDTFTNAEEISSIDYIKKIVEKNIAELTLRQHELSEHSKVLNIHSHRNEINQFREQHGLELEEYIDYEKIFEEGQIKDSPQLLKDLSQLLGNKEFAKLCEKRQFEIAQGDFPSNQKQLDSEICTNEIKLQRLDILENKVSIYLNRKTLEEQIDFGESEEPCNHTSTHDLNEKEALDEYDITELTPESELVSSIVIK